VTVPTGDVVDSATALDMGTEDDIFKYLVDGMSWMADQLLGLSIPSTVERGDPRLGRRETLETGTNRDGDCHWRKVDRREGQRCLLSGGSCPIAAIGVSNCLGGEWYR